MRSPGCRAAAVPSTAEGLELRAERSKTVRSDLLLGEAGRRRGSAAGLPSDRWHGPKRHRLPMDRARLVATRGVYGPRMTGKADFTEQEWDLVRSAPVSAGMIVIAAEHGGMMRETFAMAKAYGEAREQHGKSQLVDELAVAKPERDHTHYHSFDEMKRHGLDTVRQAIALLEEKAQADEVEEYKRFVLALVERVAKRHEEHGTAISPNEQAAIDEITGALGATPA